MAKFFYVKKANNKDSIMIVGKARALITKAKSISENPEPQLKRYYIARKVLLSGGWERPTGLARKEVLAREHKWQTEKRMENGAAKHFVGING